MRDHVPRLLCVDDEPRLLHALKEHFTRQGFVVHTATDGVEALLQLLRWSPKAVIVDLFIPRLGGLRTLHHIQSLAPGTVIILISRVPNAREMLAERGVSVAGVFRKPVDPAEISESLARAGVAPPKSSPTAAQQDLSPETSRPIRTRVLVVDDEPEFCDMLVEYLEGRGFDMLAAYDGEEALRQTQEFQPQVVLLDIWMPGLDGVETLRRIKALPQKTCVVMVSAIEDEETARQTLAMGASDYVCKPVDFAYLNSVLGIQLLMAQLDPESE